MISSFADDTNISHVVDNINDVHLLQKDLNNIYLWANENNMTFNEEKFEALRCGPNQALKDTTKLLTEGGKKVDNKPHVKCLGVFLSENATFEHHIAATIKKARGMAGWILRTISPR
ncbi:hypothetical protein Pcinc_011226 [Petrolisthes cinctipes]|uniref:Reverse transcriptase n=1 Tax=Petrolisthes cinctipes TaxID=88211 RepID=A0AAE1G399_PETCI|nr:hypothetical protein Pcinc_011226 [Petrolisthes cinctipes]